MKDLPNTAPTNGLPEVLATMCLNAKQQPLNPHKQRLLSAAARVAKVDPGAGAKPKEAKAKGKAKAAPKKKDTSQVKVTSKKDSDECQKAYSDAKKKFMDEFLVWSGNMQIKIVLGLPSLYSNSFAGLKHLVRTYLSQTERRSLCQSIVTIHHWGPKLTSKKLLQCYRTTMKLY